MVAALIVQAPVQNEDTYWCCGHCKHTSWDIQLNTHPIPCQAVDCNGRYTCQRGRKATSTEAPILVEAERDSFKAFELNHTTRSYDG